MAAFRKEMVAMTLLILLSCSWMVAGRYLPTRSDATRREQLKELLKAFLLQDIPEDHDSGRSSYPFEYHVGSMAKRSIPDPERPSAFQSNVE